MEHRWVSIAPYLQRLLLCRMSTYNNNSEEWPGSIAGLRMGIIACSISTIRAYAYTYSPNVTIATHIQTLYSIPE